MGFNNSKFTFAEDQRAAEIFRRLSILERSHRRAIPDPVEPGSVILWPSATPPTDYLICNGQSVAVADNQDLFDVIGYSYGGSGANFNVPDYRQRFLIGRDTSNSDILGVGTERGSIDHLHVASNHTHGEAGSHSHDAGGSHSHSSGGTSHQHNPAGGHQHDAGNSEHVHPQSSTGSGGSHSHSTSFTNLGDHFHTTGEPSTFRVQSGGFNAITGHQHLTNSKEVFHSHGIDSGGSHSHPNPQLGSAGGHQHAAVSDHQHPTAGGSHTHGAAGSHTHSTGNHSHGVATTTENTDSDNPPFLAMHWIIRK